MAQILEDVTQLSQDIGPRPAGTEEEQQAALYIADQFNKGAGMEADVEDFKCVPDYEMVRIVLFGVALLAALVAFLLDVAAIPAIIIGLVAAVLFVLELIDRPVVSRFFERGISQNVIARYVPPLLRERLRQRARRPRMTRTFPTGIARRVSMQGANRRAKRTTLRIALALPQRWMRRKKDCTSRISSARKKPAKRLRPSASVR